jgi:hypothetical protein
MIRRNFVKNCFFAASMAKYMIVEVSTKLQDENRENLPGVNSEFKLNYNFSDDKVVIIAQASNGNTKEVGLV